MVDVEVWSGRGVVGNGKGRVDVNVGRVVDDDGVIVVGVGVVVLMGMMMMTLTTRVRVRVRWRRGRRVGGVVRAVDHFYVARHCCLRRRG